MTAIRGRRISGVSSAILSVLFYLASNFHVHAQSRPDRQTVQDFLNAIAMNDTNTAAQLLENNTNLVLAVDNLSKQPLLEAAAAGNVQLVKRLLELGADINAQGDTYNSAGSQNTALHFAIQRNHPDICKVLLECGADPNRMAFGFETPLHLAFREGNEEIASLLLDYGAEPFQGKLFSNDETTPFELAITRSNGKLIPRMLGQDSQHPLGSKSLQKPKHLKQPRRGMKTSGEVLSRQGGELLMVAAQRGELEAVQALFRAGVSVKDANTNCPTILESFSLSANEAASNLDSTVEQLHQIQDQLKADYLPKANPDFVSSLRIQEASLAARVDAMAPERWQKILEVLIAHGADYDAFAATALDDTSQTKHLVAMDKSVVLARDCNGQTPLHWAVQTDRPRMVGFWITAGVPVDATNLAGQTAMHLAATAGKVEFVKALLAARAATNVRDTNGWTALDAAIRAKQSDCIHLLLADKSSPSLSERGFATTLHEAAASGNIAVLAALLETETNLEARNELGLTPLQLAVTKGHLGAAALLVDKGANVNVRDPEGNGLLHQILLQEQLMIYDRPPTNWLERVGQDPSKKLYVQYLTVGQYEQGPNPLLQAASFLLASGADATAKNKAGDTPMQLIVGQKTGRGVFFFDDDREKLLQLLSVHGGDVDERDADGNTALHRLCTGFYDVDKVESMASLIASGANVNATNNLGQTPLHVASGKIGLWDDNDPPVNSPFQLLVYKKADVNAQDNQGRTPLHVLSISDTSFKDEATHLLISAGANPNLQDNEGMTPLHLVASSGLAFSEGAVQNLLDAGANPNIQDKKGRTPAHLFLMGSWPWSSSGACLIKLAAAKADFSIRDDQGKTPLHYLAALGSQQPLFFIRGIDQIFVEDKVDFQTRDNDGNTPLQIAAKSGTRDVFDWLVKQGASLDETNNQGETARLLAAHSTNSNYGFSPGSAETDIFQAAREGNIDAAGRLLEADPQLVNQTNQFQQTPLRLAVMQHRTNMVSLLETHGAKWDEGSAVMAGRTDALQVILQQKPSAVDAKVYGKGLIHIAAANGDSNTVSVLVNANCNLQAKDNFGLSPMGYALIRNRKDIQVLLIQHGAKENFIDAVYANDLKSVASMLAEDKSLASDQDTNRISPVDIAVAAGYTNILKLLLKSGADISGLGRSPVHVAAFYNQVYALGLLIRAGANVNQVDRRGLTPLQWAAIRGSAEAAALLIKNKADVNQASEPDKHDPRFMMGPDQGAIAGDTALHLAALGGETNIVQLLLKAGADVKAFNTSQLTPLDLAINMRPINAFRIEMLKRGMLGILNPLGIDQMPSIQPQVNDQGKKAAAEMIKAAGGKRSQQNLLNGGRLGMPQSY